MDRLPIDSPFAAAAFRLFYDAVGPSLDRNTRLTRHYNGHEFIFARRNYNLFAFDLHQFWISCPGRWRALLSFYCNDDGHHYDESGRKPWAWGKHIQLDGTVSFVMFEVNQRAVFEKDFLMLKMHDLIDTSSLQEEIDRRTGRPLGEPQIRFNPRHR